MNEYAQSRRFDTDNLYIELAAEVFSILSDATRIRIIVVLSEGELPVNQIAELVGKPATAVSQHLAKMRLARIVAARRAGNQVYYSLADEHAQHLVMEAIFQAEHAVDEVPLHHRISAAAQELSPAEFIAAETEASK